jgi:hypothetical protein
MSEDSSNSNNKKICIDCKRESKTRLRKNRCQPCYDKINKKICIICNKLEKIINKGMCKKCDLVNKPYKKCPDCKKLHKHGTLPCSTCYKKNIQNKLTKKKCECGDPSCTEMIPIKSTTGKTMRFALGHGIKGERNPNFNNGICKQEGSYTIRIINNKNKLDHRLLYQEYYKCCLLTWAVIHHINEQKDDNRIENLKLVSNRTHGLEHKKDMSGRTCLLCGIKFEERIESNKRLWYKYENGFICRSCYNRIRYYLKK